jgi:23S rRNA U2552 (ribose-2'-O)-methylase RlmE/FtsJ
MITYTIPAINAPLYTFLQITTTPIIPPKHLSHSLSRFMTDIKEKIRKHETEWDIYKKYTNPYEYIHTNTPYKKKPVSKYKPLSRSYFKMVELIHEFRLVSFCEQPREGSTPIRTFHLAEGPGGFIEAVVNMRKNPHDEYIGMTLQDTKNDGTIPTWKKSEQFLHSHKNVFIENGSDQTGNILSLENFEYCHATYGGSMHLITADGGFDFSADFNNQELQIAELLFAQIAFALVMQKHRGDFVLKVFDCFYECTIELLALLSSFYKTTYIAKPQTSRSANSEKYIVCKGFKYTSSIPFYSYILSAFECMLREHSHSAIHSSGKSEPRTYICRFLSAKLPLYFNVKMEEYNSVFGVHQIESIHSTIALIERNTKPDRIDHFVQTNIRKCVEWCIRYNIPYNNAFYNNSFLQENAEAKNERR